MTEKRNDIPDAAKKKAELIHHGKLYVPDSIELPFRLSSSTAGPGAGGQALALTFGNIRLKMGVSRDQNLRFALSKAGENFQILKDGEIFVDNVVIIPTLLHAPNQAFVNLKDGCIYNCEFCATPQLRDVHKKDKTTDQVIEMILDASKSHGFKSVAITSGVGESPKETLDEIVEVVKKVREDLGDVEIGVEPYVQTFDDIDRLYEAGATEIKINIETYNENIFKKICPDLDYDNLLAMFSRAVAVFGRGKVATNIIAGLGESDHDIQEGVEYFAKQGVVATIRVLRINDYNYARIVEALGHDIEKVAPDRMIRLALDQKEILRKYGLTPLSFETMCHECGCCDIVPFKDI